MIFLDSDVLIDILNKSSNRGQKALETLEELEQDTFMISSIVYEEVLFGIYKKLGSDTLPQNHALLRFPVVDFSKEDAEIAAELEIEMERMGMKKPRGDVLIASTTIRQNATLYTFNRKHYQNIPDLKLL